MVINGQKVLKMKKMTIENLLIWAFTVELPKIGSTQVATTGPGYSANTSAAQFAELGTIVDRTPNDYGVIPYFTYEGEPHPDAVAVGNAVRTLADRDGYEVGKGWKPFPEWADEHGAIAAEVAKVIGGEIGRGGFLNGRQIVNLVTTAAVMKHGPDWEADAPRVVMVTRSGKPAWFISRTRIAKATGRAEAYEDDGFDVRKQRPKPGAYRKYQLDGSIRGAILGRLEWQLWRSALETLADELAGRLSAHEIAPFRPNRTPWLANQTEVGSLNTL